MKKSVQFLLMALSFVFLLKNEAKAQGVATYTIHMTGYTNQCFSGNTVPYYCFSDASPGGCGSTATCNTQTFANPVPVGNIVTNVDITVHAWQCGGTYTTNINGTNVGTGSINGSNC